MSKGWQIIQKKKSVQKQKQAGLPSEESLQIYTQGSLVRHLLQLDMCPKGEWQGGRVSNLINQTLALMKA